MDGGEIGVGGGAEVAQCRVPRPQLGRRVRFHVERGQRLRGRPRRVRQLGPAAALAETDYELRDYDRLPPGIRPTDADGTLRTRLKYVWALDHDEWKVVAAQNTAILPPPTQP